MKPNNTNLAKFYGLTRQTIGTYKKERIKIYEALKEHFIKAMKNETCKYCKHKTLNSTRLICKKGVIEHLDFAKTQNDEISLSFGCNK